MPEKTTSVSLSSDSILPLIMEQSIQIRATLTALLALEAKRLAHETGANPDETQDFWLALRDQLVHEYAANLESVRTSLVAADEPERLPSEQ